MSDDKQCFFVESPDGRKFKMVIRGDLGRLSVSKIRRYLGNYGVSDDCLLFFDGMPLEDSMIGQDFGLENNDVVTIQHDSNDNEDDGQHHAPPPPPQQQQQAVAAAQRMSGAAPLRPHDAWSQGSAGAGGGDDGVDSAAALRAQLAQAEAEKVELQRQVRGLSASAPRQQQQQQRPSLSAAQGGGGKADPLDRAKQNLKVLSDDLGVPLSFDGTGTCALNGKGRRGSSGGGEEDGLAIFISYDAQTQRVVLYTTLLTHLPLDNPPLLAKLYEVLLSGSLLGREVCGGGIGIAKDSELVVLQTSFSALHCEPTLLRDTVPVFVETVQRWRGLINELLS